MLGYPGVSVLNAARHIVQHAAARNSQLPPTGRSKVITVRPGHSAYFVVSAVDTDPDPQCPGARTGTQLRVYPPNQTKPLIQRGKKYGYQACRLAVGRVYLR